MSGIKAILADTDMLGHNGPPPLEFFGLHIEELFSLASSSVAAPVATDEQEAALDGLLDDLRKARKDADAQRAAEKKPHDDAGKAVQAAWKPLLDRCDKGADAIKAALTPYRTAKQKAKDDAVRIAREEAAAKLAEAQKALQGSDDLEARFAAEEQLKQASKLTASANRIDRSATGLRTTWEAEVDRYEVLLRWVRDSDPEPLRAFLRDYAQSAANRGVRSLAGVNFNQVRKAA